jgi:hypothetical protein
MAIDHGCQMRPTVLATGNMRHIHGPPFITPTGPTHPAPHPGARGRRPLMHEPPLLLEHSVDSFAIDDNPFLESQQHPEPPIAKGGMLLNPLTQEIRPRRVRGATSLPGPSRPMQAGAADIEDPTTASFRDPNSVALTRRMSSGPKGTVSRPPARCRYRARARRSSA